MSALQNARVETRAIDERREYFLSDDLLDVTTWRAEPRPFQKRRADPKSSAHEMVERNAADRDVPAMIGGAELDPWSPLKAASVSTSKTVICRPSSGRSE